MDGRRDRVGSANLDGKGAEFDRLKKQSPAWQRGLARGGNRTGGTVWNPKALACRHTETPKS